MPLLMPFSVCRATIELVLVRIEAIALVLLGRGAFDAAHVMNGPTHVEPMNALLTSAVPGPVSDPAAPAVRPRGGTLVDEGEARVNTGGDHA
jgi:hypothetical protein